MAGYAASGDVCLSIYSAVYAIGDLVFPHNAEVLEIGCAEADWRMIVPGLRLARRWFMVEEGLQNAPPQPDERNMQYIAFMAVKE